MSLRPTNTALLSRLRLFAVATAPTWERLEQRPFAIDGCEVVSPLRRDATPLLNLLKRLDEVTFGPEGMPMPRWMYLNSVALSGAAIGFGVPASEAGERVRRLLGVDDEYGGIVPYSVYMAIPTMEEQVWFGHNLASLRKELPEEALDGLAGLTKAVALRVMRTRRQIGATQWSSKALFVHIRLGPMHLLSAATPAHGEEGTLTYAVDTGEAALRNLAHDSGTSLSYPVATEWIDSRDAAQQAELQARINGGRKYAIVGRPEVRGEGQRVPVAEVG
jgi:hypothetical protein